MKQKITKHHYDYSIEVVKQYLNEQYEALPYVKGIVQIQNGRRWLEARKYKNDGRITAMFRESMERGAPCQEIDVTQPAIRDTFVEKRPDINLNIFDNE